LVHRTAIASTLGVLLAMLATPTSAGGSIAKVEPQNWARQGSEIRLSGTFCNGAQAPVSAGPWFAYLDPQTGPPILMGRVHIAPNTGNYCQWRLTATLEVPRVAPGAYWIRVCDRGCTKGVGDLVGTDEFTVVSAGSPRQQALQLQELRVRLRELRREEARQGQLLGDHEGSLTGAETRIVELESRVERLRDQLAAERSERGAWFGAVVVSGLVVAALTVLMTWRRRRSRFIVPDTPAELIERAHADR
jgi:hypothetical protein